MWRTTACSIPEDARGPITFTAKLKYRKFSHYYTQFAYAGQPRPGQPASAVGRASTIAAFSFDPANIPDNVSGQIKDRIPDLPIVTLAEATASLQVGDGRRRPSGGRSSRSRIASAGTTGASACCCRAISKARSTRSRR